MEALFCRYYNYLLLKKVRESIKAIRAKSPACPVAANVITQRPGRGAGCDVPDPQRGYYLGGMAEHATGTVALLSPWADDTTRKAISGYSRLPSGLLHAPSCSLHLLLPFSPSSSVLYKIRQ
ncbi:hypothetical protein F4677DRAFT_431749 [Hypoxylon crocopeplum]|nr:hypothetical protein F4677DRAFT_431749 [Hypoxylon crocopeplum]